MEDNTTVENDATNMLPSEYIETLRPTIVRIGIDWLNDKGKPVVGHGTGIVIGRKKNAGDIIIATARHVIEDAPDDRPVNWTLLQQYVDTGDEHRTITFTSKPGENIVSWHKDFDIAFVVVFNKYIPDGDYAEDYNRPASAISPLQGASQGTPVAWAGFPGIVEEYVGHVQLVVHSGIVGAMIHGEGKRKRFIIDGHAAMGVSGGPVWHFSVERKRAEVVGIIVGTGFYPSQVEKGELPGYIDVEPLGPLMYFLEEHRKDNDDWIITDWWANAQKSTKPSDA